MISENHAKEPWCETCHPTGASGDVSDMKDASRVFVPYGESLRNKGFEGFFLYGWRRSSEMSVHLLPNVEFAIASAVADFYKKWKYVPPNLSVRFVHMGAMGRTLLVPSPESVHWVLLNRRLLEAYTLEAIRRVMLHELSHCLRHHQAGYQLLDEPHDDRFCQILSKVDKLVAGSAAKCKFFNDDVDAIHAKESLGNRLRGGGTLTIWTENGRRFFELETAAGVVLRRGKLINHELLEIAAGLDENQRKIVVRLRSSKRGKEIAPATTFDRFFLSEVAGGKPAFRKIAGPYVLAPLERRRPPPPPAPPRSKASSARKTSSAPPLRKTTKKKRTAPGARGTMQRGSRS